MEGIKKIKSLLKFYKENNVKIQLKFNSINEIVVNGIVIDNDLFFRKYIILQSKESSPIKIFLEEIYFDSIIPFDLIDESGKKKKNKNKREPMSLKLRHEVLKRDKYVCQGCGACGPRVEVEADHIIPVSRGGKDTLENLQTLCFKCNRGKGDQLE